MDTIKATVFSTLSTLTGVAVSQSTQGLVNSFPAVTFALSDNENTIDLDANLLHQDVEITVDVWAKSSTVCSSTLSAAEAKLRAIGYRMTFMADIPDPDDSVFHISTRFTSLV